MIPDFSISNVCFRFSPSSSSEALSPSGPMSFPSSSSPVRIAFWRVSTLSLGRTDAPKEMDELVVGGRLACRSALKREMPGLGGFEESVASKGTSCRRSEPKLAKERLTYSPAYPIHPRPHVNELSWPDEHPHRSFLGGGCIPRRSPAADSLA